MADIQGRNDAWIDAIRRLSFWLESLLEHLDNLLLVRKQTKVKKKEFNKYRIWVNHNIDIVEHPGGGNVPVMTVMKQAGAGGVVKLWQDFVRSFEGERYDEARKHLVNLIEVCSGIM